MPVILEEFDWDRWLDPNLNDPAELLALLQPAAEEVLEAVPVGPLVNSAKNQGRELIAPIGSPIVV